MAKLYDRDLDARTKPILDLVYSAYLVYSGARRVAEEPENPEDYKRYDKICVRPDGSNLLIEGEVRNPDGNYQVWRGPNKAFFGEKTVHVPERKRDSAAELYFSINPTGTAFAVTKMEFIKASPVVGVSACNESDMLAFDVPDRLWDFYYVEGGTLQLQERSEDNERYLIPLPVPALSIK
jgi:hypothetical protein